MECGSERDYERGWNARVEVSQCGREALGVLRAVPVSQAIMSFITLIMARRTDLYVPVGGAVSDVAARM